MPQGHRQSGTKSSENKLRRIDFLGALLLFTASICIVTALEEGGVEYELTSPVVLASFDGVWWSGIRSIPQWQK